MHAVARVTPDSALTRNHHHLFDRIASTLQLTADGAEAYRRSCCVASAAAAASCLPSQSLSGLTADSTTSLERSALSQVTSCACEPSFGSWIARVSELEQLWLLLFLIAQLVDGLETLAIRGSFGGTSCGLSCVRNRGAAGPGAWKLLLLCVGDKVRCRL